MLLSFSPLCPLDLFMLQLRVEEEARDPTFRSFYDYREIRLNV